MYHSIRRIYCVLRMVVALALPPGSAYCEDVTIMDDHVTGRVSPASHGYVLASAGKAEPLACYGINDADTQFQGKDMRVLLCWRLNEAGHVNGGVQTDSTPGITGYLHVRPETYADAFKTLGLLFRQVAFIANSLKGNITRGIAPMAQSPGPGFSVGMHTPDSHDTDIEMGNSGIVAEKYINHFEPCLTVTFRFGS